MADVHAISLCTEIIHDHFGPLTATVAGALLKRGRQNLRDIYRFTQLNIRTIRASIIVLAQHNLLWHRETEEEGEVFEFNVLECLTRLRYGRFVWIARKEMGKVAADVVQCVLDHGKLRQPDIISALGLTERKEISKCKEAIYELVSSFYLRPYTAIHNSSRQDRLMRYETEEKAKLPKGVPSAKELLAAKEAAALRLQKEEEDADKIGLKRRTNGSSESRPSKKSKLEDDEVDTTVYFRINSEKFNIHIWNKVIEVAARERFNESAALVLRQAMELTVAQQKSLAEPRSDPFSVASVAMEFDDKDKTLRAGLKLPDGSRPSNAALVKEYFGILSFADNPTPVGTASAFISMKGGNKAQVEFEAIGKRLRIRMLESATRDRHGEDGLRVLRLLIEKGKMDEKQISKVAMLGQKDVRGFLTAMSNESFVSLQEVAKSADRDPKRTMYFWYVDLNKASAVLLSTLYKTLFNLSRRRRAEAEKADVKAVLEKRERKDVSENEELLNRFEREVLKAFEEKCDRLAVLEARVDESVFILRDLSVFEAEDGK